MADVVALWDRPADAAALVDDAAWAAAREYIAAPHTAVEETPRRRWLITGTPYEGLNGVYWAADLDVDQALRPFRQAEVPMLWHVGPTSPAALPAALREAGLSHYGDEPGMLLDLDATDEWQRDLTPPAGLEIRKVGTRAQLRAWVRVWAGPAGHVVIDRLVALRSATAFGVAPRTPHLMAVVDGVPVGCAAIWVGRLTRDTRGYSTGRPVAWLEHVATGFSARRRGVGTALVRGCLELARSRGVSHVALTASPFAERLYHRLGFHQVCTVRRYLWTPTDEPPA